MPAIKHKRAVSYAHDAFDRRDMSPETMRRRAETCRLRIDTTKLLDRLQKHVLGRTKMTPTQVQAAQALLKKTLPDLVSAKTELEFSPVVFNFAIAPAPPIDVPALPLKE